MQQLVLKHGYWLMGCKGEVLEQLQRLSRSYGNIPFVQLLKLLQT